MRASSVVKRQLMVAARLFRSKIMEIIGQLKLWSFLVDSDRAKEVDNHTVCVIVVGNTHGCPAAVKHFDEFYKVLQSGGLAKKGALIGISRGGLYCYNFAAAFPDRVACIYGDAPVCDFKSWPGGKGKGQGSAGEWAALIKNYGFKDEAKAIAYKKNPIDELTPIAGAKIALIHVVGDVDKAVPVEENTSIIERRYKELGGKMIVIHKPTGDHHPHGLDDPKPVVDFILEQTAAALK
jgi:hypothetical protein